MKTRVAFTFGLSALLFGGSMVGCTHQGGVASASARNAAQKEQQAAKLAEKAGKALAKRKGGDAVDYAEAAVKLQPRDATYRSLLGRSYLQAGRFASAHQAFVDVLALDPSNARAALNLALAQTAEGDWAGARRTLADHADEIPVSDRGLAEALAGDPKGAVKILLPAARTPGATAKTRQNLALAMALAGDWRAARVIVSMDLSPAQVDKRLASWAAFAQPRAASDQVASLLGVTPSRDPGQPVALALNAPAAPQAMADAKAPDAVADMSADAPQAGDNTTLAAADVATAASAPVAQPQQIAVTFAPRREVVQPLPLRSKPAVSRHHAAMVEQASAKATPRALSPGNYFVQFGAYENAAVAHDGWARAQRRLPALANWTPQGMTFSTGGVDYYRLSVGGFAKADARALCNRYHAKGGRCFIRTGAGDQVAQWVKKGQELASR